MKRILLVLALFIIVILSACAPEMYLRADGLFVEMIETNPGFKKAYQTNDVHSDYLIPVCLVRPSNTSWQQRTVV